MKNLLPLFTAAFVLALFISKMSFAQQQSPDFANIRSLDQYHPEYKEDIVLVKFSDSVIIEMSESGTQLKSGSPGIKDLFDKYGVTEAQKVFPKTERKSEATYLKDFYGRKKEVPQLFNIYKLQLKDGADPREVSTAMNREKEVEYAEPDYLVYTQATDPDDPYFQNGEQWHLTFVNAPEAWDSTRSDPETVIGVIDTGVDWLHPDLDDNIWNNDAEIPGNGIDDDNNGYIDDTKGWDFINNDNDPDDDNSHGTHVAGIISAEADNGIGVAGVAPEATIMPVKVLQSSGQGSSGDLAAGILYASENGADVINMSLGTYAESMTVRAALESAYASSILVAAAGNDALSLEGKKPPFGPHFPAAYSYVIGVEATKPSPGPCGGREPTWLACFSNFDPSGPVYAGNDEGHNYEMRAPGQQIMSTFPNGKYHNLSGTSMASPVVAGAAALYKSLHPEESQETLYARLIQGSNSNRILDIYKSLTMELLPSLSYATHSLTDTLNNGDEDQVPDAGETIEFSIAAKNVGGQADSVWAKLRFGKFEDPSVADIIDSTSHIGDMSEYSTLSADADPIRVKLNSDIANGRDVIFEYEIGAKNWNNTTSGEIIIKVLNGTELIGVMDSTLTLTPDKLWITSNSFRVASNGKLTILPGTHIKLFKNFDVRGEVIAHGTADSLIMFEGPGTIVGPGAIDFRYVNIFGMKQTFGWDRDGFYKFDKCQFYNIDIKNPLFNQVDVHLTASDIRNSSFDRLGGGYHPFLKRVNVSNCNIGGRSEEGAYEYCNFVGNYIYDWAEAIWYAPSADNNPPVFKGTSLISRSQKDGENNYFLWSKPDADVVEYDSIYWGTTDEDKIQDKMWDFWDDARLSMIDYSPILNSPSDSALGVVWKIEVNQTDPQDEHLDPLGTEEVRFDVYFNRPMDTSVTPLVTFGVREPWTQQRVMNKSKWSSDSTIFTTYKTIGLNTGDGINTLRVADAIDNQGFEIPVEKWRFSFNIQAAAAESNQFMAIPGIGKVELEWPFSHSEEVLGYNMYRCMNETDSTLTDTVLINQTLITDSVYLDYEVIPDSTYHYMYKTVGTDMEESSYSKRITAVPFSAADGDANGDQSVDVLDITSIVSYLLEEDPEPFLFDAADVNYDDQINVLDIIGVADLVSGSKKAAVSGDTNPEKAYMMASDDSIILESVGNIAALQFTLEGESLENQKLLLETPGFEFAYRYNEETGRAIGVIYSLSGNEIPEGEELIIRIKGDSPVSIASATGGDLQGREVPVIIGGDTDVQPVADKGKSIGVRIIPNPFKQQTRIHYTMPQAGRVTIEFYNTRGTVIDKQTLGKQPEGKHMVTWSSNKQTGKVVFCRIRVVTPNGKELYSKTEKMVKY